MIEGLALVSIIVPVYNADNYLEICLDSIRMQSYPNIEVLLVDNGSSDKSIEICRTFSKTDKRFHVLVCKERGASCARNEGLKYASGYYVMFVDSDDYVDRDYCEVMVKCISKNQATLAVCGMALVKENGTFVRNRDCFDSNSVGIYESEEIISLLQEGQILNSLFNKIYIREFIKIEFNPEFRIGEDLLFNIEYINNEHTVICCTEKILYHYRIFSDLPEAKLKYYTVGRMESVLKLYYYMAELGNKFGYSEKYFESLVNIYAANIIFCIKEWVKVDYRKSDLLKKIDALVTDKLVVTIAKRANLDIVVKKAILCCIVKKRKKTLYLMLSTYGKVNKAKNIYGNSKNRF